MPETNPLGDVELTDPRAMRALAHPVRLAILGRLRQDGPSTATRLSPQVGATPSVTSWHLRHLAEFGLVQDAGPGQDGRERRWESVGLGFRFAAPKDPDDTVGFAAALALERQMFLRYGDEPLRWLEEVEPTLERPWRSAAGLSHTRVAVTTTELAGILDAVEAALAPYVMRAEAERPTDTRWVRLLRYTMPEPAPPGDGPPDEAADSGPRRTDR